MRGSEELVQLSSKHEGSWPTPKTWEISDIRLAPHWDALVTFFDAGGNKLYSERREFEVAK